MSTPPRTPPGAPHPRRPYVAPDVEALGRWHALTLQQSVPLGDPDWGIVPPYPDPPILDGPSALEGFFDDVLGPAGGAPRP